jgi:hypothetical protein
MGPKGGVFGSCFMEVLEGGRPKMCRAPGSGYDLLGALMYRKNWTFFPTQPLSGSCQVLWYRYTGLHTGREFLYQKNMPTFNWVDI